MNKTIAAATLAAIALPGAALADGSDRAAEAHKKNSERKAHKTHGAKAKAFVVKGVDASNLTVTDGALAGALTLDPTSANKHARKALELTKTELKGEDTVTFGTAGDKTLIKYEGLAPTDVVKVIGKVNRSGEINIRKITVTRGETETEQAETETKKAHS